MRIVVLAHNLCTAGGKSVGQNIAATLADDSGGHDVLMIVPAESGYAEGGRNAKCRIEAVGARRLLQRAEFEVVGVHRWCRQFKPDVIWALGNVAIRRPPCAQALLLHNPHRVYALDQSLNTTLWSRTLRQIRNLDFGTRLRYVQLVFTQTVAMQRQLLKRWRFGGRMAIMPNAVSRFVNSSGNSAAVSRLPDELEQRMSARFCLFCLTKYYSHKNLEMIARCYAEYRKELSDTMCILTISPSQGRGATRLLRYIRDSGLEDLVVNVGPLDQEALAGYYHASGGLLLPTLLESFTGTYLEAMQFGKPILTSDRDFAREICGDAAIYFDPHDPAALKEAIRRVVDNEKVRTALCERGKRRLSELNVAWCEIVPAALRELEMLVSS